MKTNRQLLRLNVTVRDTKMHRSRFDELTQPLRVCPIPCRVWDAFAGQPSGRFLEGHFPGGPGVRRGATFDDRPNQSPPEAENESGTGFGGAAVGAWFVGIFGSKSWRKRLVLGLAGLIVVWVMLRWLERHLVYFPSTHLVASGDELGRPVEDVFFVARDGVRLNGWFYPAAKDSARARLVMLLLHGNAGNLSHRLNYYQAWQELGLNVLAVDYRGYGRSEGRPGEAGTYLDGQAACEWLRRKGFAPANIILLGKSLGGGVAAEVALRETVGGLVLQSTFTSLLELGQELYPWLPVRWLNTIKYETRSKLPQLSCPVLVMHSRADELIRFHHGEDLFAVAREPKMFWELAGGHNQTLEAGRAQYLDGLERFLAAFFSATNAAKAAEVTK